MAPKNSSNRVVFASFRAWDHRLRPKPRNVWLAIMVILLYGSVGLASACRSQKSDDIHGLCFAHCRPRCWQFAAQVAVGSLWICVWQQKCGQWLFLFHWFVEALSFATGLFKTVAFELCSFCWCSCCCFFFVFFVLLAGDVCFVDGLIAEEMFVQVSVVQISRPVRKPGWRIDTVGHFPEDANHWSVLLDEMFGEILVIKTVCCCCCCCCRCCCCSCCCCCFNFCQLHGQTHLTRSVLYHFCD